MHVIVLVSLSSSVPQYCSSIVMLLVIVVPAHGPMPWLQCPMREHCASCLRDTTARSHPCLLQQLE